MYATSLVTLMPGYLNSYDVDHTFSVGHALWLAQGADDAVFHIHVDVFMQVCMYIPCLYLCGLTVVVCACRHDHPVGYHTYIVWVDYLVGPGRRCLFHSLASMHEPAVIDHILLSGVLFFHTHICI